MFAPIAGRRRLTACILLALLALGLALGIVLALPADTSACPAPSGAGRADCMNHAWGRVATIALLVSLGTAALGHMLCVTGVRVASWVEGLTGARPARPAQAVFRSPSRTSRPRAAASQPRPVR